MNDVTTLWHAQRDVLIGERVETSDSVLWDLLGMIIGGKMSFGSFVDTISKGWGCGVDGGDISLPVNIVEDANEAGRVDKTFCVEVRLTELGDEHGKIARAPVSKFLFCSSVATVMHATHVDPDLDPYSAIERMRAACSPEFQFSLVRDVDKLAVDLKLEHWQQQAFS